jgi:flagellar hook-associated protein 3 FlgL
MRITNRMMVDNAIQNMGDNLERMSKLQAKLSTQKQFQNASDDPARASASLSLRSNLRTLEAYADTAANTENWMTATDNALDRMEGIATRASNLILRGLNDSLSASERANSLGTEMQTLLNEAVEVGNTSVNNQFIFSGYQVSQKAFSLADAAAQLPDYQGTLFTPQVVSYNGDTGSMQRSLGPDQSVTVNVRGDQAILGFLQNLVLAANALRQNNIRNSNDPQNDPLTLQTALSGLQSSLSTMNEYRTSNGARLRQVESASTFLETVQIETKSLLSQKEDTNLAEGISLLTNQQTTYQAVLEVSQRAISTLSLFDYLR